VQRSTEELFADADRQLTICNACRYCEGYCAVFPALELRTHFESGDISYLANLCHDCRGCYQACMYTPPHEFGVNLPALLSDVRAETYSRYAFPRSLAGAFNRGPLALAIATILASAIVGLVLWLSGQGDGIFDRHQGPGAFYDVVPYVGMVVPALLISAWGLAVVAIGTMRFWRSAGGSWQDLVRPAHWRTALDEAAKLRWLHGGGGDCFVPDAERPSPWRRRFHHFVFYGFLLSFLATVSAAVAENLLHQKPPYAVISVPVILGIIGGTGLMIGCLGLVAVRRSPKESTDALGVSFLLILFLVSLSGMVLLVLRDTKVMGTMLLLHLILVFALYLTAPYGRFVHAAYRLMALVKSASER